MNLILITAYDLPGWQTYRASAKLLCASLLRSFWDGEIIVTRNMVQPLFPVERKGLEEIHVKTEFEGREVDRIRCGREALASQFAMSEAIASPERYEWILHLDADCLALRDIGHLLEVEADILVQPTGKPVAAENFIESVGNPWLGGKEIASGVLAIRGGRYREIIMAWKTNCDDPASIPPAKDLKHETLHRYRMRYALHRTLAETELKVRPFERGEVMRPFGKDTSFADYRHAALLDFSGGERKDKQDLAFALHMMRTYGDESGLFLDLLES